MTDYGFVLILTNVFQECKFRVSRRRIQFVNDSIDNVT